MNMRVLLYPLVIAFQAIVLDGSQHHVLAREFARYIDPVDHRPRRCMAAVWVGSNIGSQKIDVPIVKENDLRSFGYSEYIPYNAYSNWDRRRTSRPFIYLNYTNLSKYPPIVTRFVFYHECGHLCANPPHCTVWTHDEIMANCVALKTIRAAGDLSLEDEATLREYHYRMGDLDKSLGAGDSGKSLLGRYGSMRGRSFIRGQIVAPLTAPLKSRVTICCSEVHWIEITRDMRGLKASGEGDAECD